MNKRSTMAYLVALGVSSVLAGCVGSDSVAGESEPLPPSEAPVDGPTTSPPPSSASTDALESEIAQLVGAHIDATGRDRDKAIGLIVRVESASLQKTFAFGSLKKGGDVRPTGGEAWVIGSVSKVFTAFLVASKVADGALAVSDPVASRLPAGWSVPNGAGGEPITVGQLLAHVSGLPRYPKKLSAAVEKATSIDALGAAWGKYTLSDLRSDLSETTLSAAPGTKYEYSDFGYALAQVVATEAHARPFNEALHAAIDPLGLRSTFAPEELGDPPRIPLMQGHAGPRLDEVPVIAAPVFTGDGYLYSTALDLGAYLRLFARLDPAPNATVSKAIELMETSVFERTANDTPIRQGLGLGIIPGAGFTLFKKNGTASGATSVILYDRERRIAIAIGTNTPQSRDPVNISACAVLQAVAKHQGAAYTQLAGCETPL